MPAMRVKARVPCGEVAVLTLEGTLDAPAASELLDALQQQLPRSNKVVLDLRDVTQADSAGLGALVRALKAARDAGGDLALAGPQPAVARLMSDIGLDQVLGIADDVFQARARLSKT